MGLGASQARLLLLTAQKSSLELQGQDVNGERLLLSTQESDAMQTYANVLSTTDDDDERDDAYAEYEATVSEIQTLDQALEIQLNNVDTEQQAVQTEIEAVESVIDKNIEMSYKTFSS